MLLAAGRGERMRPLTDTCPKPLLTMRGKPLIVWQIERLRAAGIVDVVINTAWLGEQLVAALGDGSALGVRVAWSHEAIHLTPGGQIGPWETGGGIATALPLLGDAPFISVSADIFTEFDFALLHGPAEIIARDPLKRCAHFVLVDNPPHHPAGDMALDEHGLARHTGAAPGTRLNYSNIAVWHPSLFKGRPVNTKWKLFPWAYQFVDAGRVSAEHYRGCWENVGTVEQLSSLNNADAAG